MNTKKYLTVMSEFTEKRNKQKLPNVVFLSVEALRFDRVEPSGYGRPTTPNLNKLVENALWCSNCFSLAPCTQPSMPAMLSSTMPLSYGGYDFGVKSRPKTFPEILQEAGYWTEHQITVPWLVQTYGYNKGANKTAKLFPISGVVGTAVYTLRSTVREWAQSNLDDDVMLKSVMPIVNQCFEDVISYCEERLDSEEQGILKRFFKHSKFANDGLDYRSVMLMVQKHQNEFNTAPKKYVQKHLVGLPPNARASWIMKDILELTKPYQKLEVLRQFCSQIFENPVSWPHITLAKYRQKIYPDGSELTDLIESRLEFLSQKEEPFFLWTHFFDTHVPYCPGEFPSWAKDARKILSTLGYDENMNLSTVHKTAPATDEERRVWSAMYDCAVWYVDKQIGRVVDALKNNGVYENTIIVIVGDHGEELGEHGEYGHRFKLYDECLRVPFVIHSPKFKQKQIRGLSDLMDLAPTLAACLKFEPVPEWIGRDLNTGSIDREYVISECFYRGSCLFPKKPIYMAVRTDYYKYIWREWIDNEDVLTKDRCELYDLKVDPAEQHNIIWDHADVVEKMQLKVGARLAQIPEFIKNRSPEELEKAGVRMPLRAV